MWLLHPFPVTSVLNLFSHWHMPIATLCEDNIIEHLLWHVHVYSNVFSIVIGTEEDDLQKSGYYS